MARKIILNLAISLDGYISDTDGGFDWIKGHNNKLQNTKNQFDMDKFMDSVDIVVMGKEAYLDCGIENIKGYQCKQFYVASNSDIEIKHDNVEIISGDIVSKIVSMRMDRGQNIWLFGGAGLVDPFIKADVIDQYIIGVIPVILGKGRPLFLGRDSKLELHLEETTIDDGIAMLIYRRRT